MSPQKGPISPAEVIARDCIAVRLRALNRAVSALYDEALRPHGLRVGQLNLLVAVARMKLALPADLCRVLRMEKSTLSRDVEVMRRNGWLEVDDSAGGRSRPLHITQTGRTMLDAVLPSWQEAQKKAKALLGKEAVAAIQQIALDHHRGAPQGA
ncbi:MAG TPA: MarR family winged helix-turn-helix transcriptional regulator [Isosphaeraceae bacterium]|jgi:DNA-binding MarR family transcriptional regulator|nr:MarR family winged helix-turn-helix transcriptional regulator [Isosphaeraceae bacterium]